MSETNSIIGICTICHKEVYGSDEYFNGTVQEKILVLDDRLVSHKLCNEVPEWMGKIFIPEKFKRKRFKINLSI